MKPILFILTLVALFSCGNSSKANSQTNTPTAKSGISKDYIEVLYFHGKQRCITCNTIEKLTKEVLDKDFVQQLKDGKIVFKIIDISKKENEKIAEKYEVTWSSLFVNKWKGGKETPNNMTEFAFSYAKSSPDVFKEGLIKKINELLK